MSDKKGYFGNFGGRYVPEVLRASLMELEESYRKVIDDPDFKKELSDLHKHFTGRPTPLLKAENASKELGGATIYIKLEGLANTGAHKINNALGQALLAKRMGKTRIIAETGAGQHGVATASACARLGLECEIYMGSEDIRRQHPNVFWMELFGAKVIPVESGSRTLKDAVNQAFRDWTSSFTDTHYLLGSALGPAPYPEMVRSFQSIIGEEVKEQAEFPIHTMVACVGGGSNAIGFFSPFIDRDKPRLVGVEAGGRGKASGEHAVRMSGMGSPGIVQGYKSCFLLDEDGQVEPTHSISAGLDYPGIGPQLAHLGETGRIEFTSSTDEETLKALKFFARTEGIIFAMESAHAGAAAMKIAKEMKQEENLIINMSGRGDKDIFISAPALDKESWLKFLDEERERIHGK
ncbi:MAG: tryptophan synthase subunit beta [Spirochaetales bacterium]|nr:tryptophan synthase subunit beta [Spirochaetales bacterium]